MKQKRENHQRKINETKSQFFVKINTVNSYFARLIKIKEGDRETRAEQQHQMLTLILPLSDIDCRQWNSQDKFGDPRLEATSFSCFIWNTRSCQSNRYFDIMTWKQQTERACHNPQPPAMPKNFRRASRCSPCHKERFGTQLRNSQQEDSLGFDEGHKKNVFPLRKLSFFICKIVLITIYLHLFYKTIRLF